MRADLLYRPCDGCVAVPIESEPPLTVCVAFMGDRACKGGDARALASYVRSILGG